MTFLLLKCGSASAPVRAALGDYDRWFLRALAPAGVSIRVIEAHAGAPLPSRRRGSGPFGYSFDAVIATGSQRSVRERAPWMVRAAEWLRGAGERGLPVLGVCFGHQLLAEAYGGAVRRNPQGREIGTVRCTLTRGGLDDPLFDGIPPAFEVQATHEDEVRALPPGAELLATNAFSRVQAFAIGKNVRAVQFHPEMNLAAMRAVVVARAGTPSPATGPLSPTLSSASPGRGSVLTLALAGIRGTPWGESILANFARLIARARA